MSIIRSEAVISVYLDSAAFLLMILLLCLSRPIRQRKNLPMRCFFLFCVAVTLSCPVCLVYNALYLQKAAWTHTAALIFRTLREYLIIAVVNLWFVYVNSHLFSNQKWNSRRNLILFFPAYAFYILLTVNLFTGIIFTISPANQMVPKPLYYVLFGIDFLYFITSLPVWQFTTRKTKKRRLFSVVPMLLFVLIGAVPQFFTQHDVGILGFVVGVNILYFSMINEFRFMDEESGLYNKGYMTYLFDLAVSGKNAYNSALIIEAEGNIPACIGILRDVLGPTGEMIRLEKNLFLMCSDTDSRSRLQYLISLVEEAAAKYNEENPDGKITMHSRCRMRTVDEDSFTFLRNVMETKETGDTMRGIVSMMSELDRLDKELELATDIQASVLPADFPPFPGRTEFDLYASMTPAKEVGGDFYDFFLIDNDHLAMIVADVSGKGVPAALFMMVSKSLVKNQLLSCGDPEQALDRVNLQLCERNSSMTFVTMWIAVLELSTGKGVACNAGHENPVLRRADGSFVIQRYKHDMIVGVRKKAKFHSHEFELYPGDCIFSYTDGVPEANNGTKEMFGEDRLVKALNKNPDASPEELIHRVHNAVDQFADNAPQFDDITMLCLRYNGSANA